MASYEDLDVMERLLFLLSEREKEVALLYQELAKQPVPAATPATVRGSTRTPIVGSPPALVAGSSALLRVRIAQALGDDGWDVKTVADGPEAVDQLHRKSYGLLVLDYQLKHVEPNALLQVLHASLPQLGTIVLIPPDHDTAQRLEAADSGSGVVLTKPINMLKLLAAARDHHQTRIRAEAA